MTAVVIADDYGSRACGILAIMSHTDNAPIMSLCGRVTDLIGISSRSVPCRYGQDNRSILDGLEDSAP